VRKIKLTQGKETLVDDDLYEELNKFKWHYALGYARRNIRTNDGKRKIVFMHREIMNTPDGFETDHINGNTLENRKENLRIVTREMNQHNSKAREGKSKYKGVTWYITPRHKTGRWLARIQVNKKRVVIGYYKNEEEAAIAYNEAALKYYGEIVRLNKIGVTTL
jgi:hypothetical protein